MAEVTVGGVRLHVQRLGHPPGRPVVFVHGLVMDNLSSWYFTVANPVAATHPTWLYDLRGHGRSGRPDTGYDLDTLVGELAGLLDAEGLNSARLVGNSFGGLLALAFARTHPDRCDGLALVDALLPEPGWGERMVGTLGLQGDDRDATIGRAFAAWLGRHSERKRNRLAAQARALVEDTTLLADLRGSRAWTDDAWSSLTCPILAIYGADSDVRHHGERLAAHAPDCTLELVPGGSHSVLWEATDRVRQRIVEWL